jgi:FAD/FMN-containing dehydrogenase
MIINSARFPVRFHSQPLQNTSEIVHLTGREFHFTRLLYPLQYIGSKYPFPIPVKINAHIGDGNLHIVLCKCDLDDATWEKIVHDFHEEVYAYAYAQGGRLAGEHGIGAKKLAYMEEFTPAGELELMRRIKLAWDPNLI